MKLLIFKKGNEPLKQNEIYLNWVFNSFQSILSYYLHSAYNSSEYERIVIDESKCIWKIDNKGKLTLLLHDNQIKKVKSRFVNINNVFEI